MRSRHTAVTTSTSAEEIRTYCHTLARELGLTVESVWWGYALDLDHAEAPYYLHISITNPFDAIPEFWFTRAQVLEYATGQTKGAIQSEIRRGLEIRLRHDL